MPKYSITIVILLIILGAAVGFWLFEIRVPKEPSQMEHLTIRIPLHSWTFEPEDVVIKQGSAVEIKVVNDDDIEHGFAIDEYRIAMDIPPSSTITIPPFVADKVGTVRFYCSVICGDGTVSTGVHAGATRGHFDMKGTLRVIDPGTSIVPTGSSSLPADK